MSTTGSCLRSKMESFSTSSTASKATIYSLIYSSAYKNSEIEKCLKCAIHKIIYLKSDFEYP